jgi:hypothetical protein
MKHDNATELQRLSGKNNIFFIRENPFYPFHPRSIFNIYRK